MNRTCARISKTLAVAALVAGIGLIGPASVVAQQPTVFTVLDYGGSDAWFGTLDPQSRRTLVRVLPTNNLIVTDMTFSNFGSVRTCARLLVDNGALSGKILVPPDGTVTISLAAGYKVNGNDVLSLKNCSSNPTELEYTISGFYARLADPA